MSIKLQKKEQDKKQTEKEWSKQRDDMLCDDLLDLPVPIPLKMSGDDFGNAVMIMEFIYGFKALCELELPNNFNIVSLVESLYEQHSPTLYLDLIQQLLAVIFQMQSGLPELNSSWKAAYKYDQDVQDGMVLIKLFQSVSTIKKLKSNKTFNDGFNDIKAEYKASEFSRNYPEIMKKLSVGNILDLKPGEKLVLLANLIEQVLSLPACRDLIEENYNKLKNVQKDLRAHVYAVQRREKDFLNYKSVLHFMSSFFAAVTIILFRITCYFNF
ncbi:hypothetical protein HELRODRAFT_175841 [Helobdella robusta]|uniref:DDT domain-containing protein n=1 Tax=Helobdella robusta TaxID=6412 RepID=T1F9R3_HELRO|nr:hypothetical protein HELRODRAFT_175841 [Helobdella robusta]ESO00420.1 hypothetical protein HELRODRAFT_175841 [Helobdella robusta]